MKGQFTVEGTTLADRLQERVAGVGLIVGSLLWAPMTYFEYPTTFVEYSDGLFVAGAVGLLVYALLVPGLLGVARMLRHGAPRLSVAAGLLATSGCVAGATFQTALMHEW